ncbi:MAG: single-stranded-DNA-specific exonuclease RecJ [Defluviitaleaceae bacterium]|nr:single-stranded-DNA-specific exonuclease RecJ [Defluviitaleaceae bacterium]
MKKWKLYETDADIEKMSQVLGVSPVLCRIMANRGVRTKNTAIRYLNPSLKLMREGSLIAGMDAAVEIARRGISDGERFCIFGDYDVDGVSATVILHQALTGLLADCGYYIPHRQLEGYGPNMAAMEQIANEYDILITVDSGIAAVEELQYAVDLGLTVIIIDHHTPPSDGGVETLPPAHAIINPKQAACDFPFELMCAAGLSYKFAVHLYENFGKEYEKAKEALIFAAIATFCDIVDLVDENRIIAKNGLLTLNTEFSTNIGLNALVKARNLEYNDIDDFALGFVLGPCINASGRLESAEIAVELFLTDNAARADELAAQLVRLNDERKDMCAKFVEDTVKNLPGESELDDILVIYHPTLHESIAGIVAGRVREHTGRPTIVLSKAGDVAKGSARSIEGYDIFCEMQKHKELFERFGGHPMAAGVTMPIENIDILRQRLNADSTLTNEDFYPVLYGEGWLALDDCTYELARDLSALSPFGKGNREPVFFVTGIVTERVEIIGASGQTLRMTLRSDTGRKITAIGFKAVDKMVEHLSERYNDEIAEGFASRSLKKLNIKLDIAFNIRINTYMGNSSVQLIILDFK